MNKHTNETLSLQPLCIEELDRVTGGENVVNGHVGMRFEPTTRAQPWTPCVGRDRRHHNC